MLFFKYPRKGHTKVEVCQLISQSDICQLTIFLADVWQKSLAFDVFTSYSAMPFITCSYFLHNFLTMSSLIIHLDLLLSASTEKQIVTA